MSTYILLDFDFLLPFLDFDFLWFLRDIRVCFLPPRISTAKFSKSLLTLSGSLINSHILLYSRLW
jgi:hypothetical protein